MVSTAAAPPEIAELVMSVGERDHIQGSAGAPVTLVEYGDYECPYCGQAYPIIKNIQKAVGDKLRFVFRNFPITQIHPHAQHAAEAAEAAAAQDKFWEMHDWLYEHQAELDDNNLKEHTSAIGIEDVRRFEVELSGHVYAGRVREDFMSGIRSGVNGTPTFYINGRRYDDSWNEETLLTSIWELIPANQQTTSKSSKKKAARKGVSKRTRQRS